MMFASENLFLIFIGLVWIIGAVLQDLRRREVDNIWNFSLIGIALAYRLAYSAYIGEYMFFVNGLIGFGIFLVIGNAFYYGRIFAGGDAKLLIALGTILPLSFNWTENILIFGYFILFFMLGGSIYVFIWSLVLVFFNFNKFAREFGKQYGLNKKIVIYGFVFFVVWSVLSFFIEARLTLLGILFILGPFLYVFAKSVEESLMIRSYMPEDLGEGEWLYEDLIVDGKKIKANWDGVSRRELELIRKKYRRKIWVKQGIPFTPGFLIGFIGLLFMDWHGFMGF
ncbi:hypothetical protein CMI42_06055 [Candidatus Pacearchaeota archaeon]|nr:hypothetical protein [Candidatus Pacearchaeota archaeon]